MRCENCGQEQPPAAFCAHCGLRMTRILVDAVEAEAPQQAPAPSRCPTCGHVQATGKFCDRCGIRIPQFVAASQTSGEDPEDGRQCRLCEMKTKLPCCPNCGIRILEEQG